MNDTVLFSRLEALRNNLKLVSANLESTAWKTDQTRAELLGESSLWAGLQATLVNEIRIYLRRLEEIERDLRDARSDDNAAVSAAWTRHGEIMTSSQDLLRECFEIIGTLAIRSKDLDRKALHVADELIRDCMTLSTGGQDYFLLVHSLKDTFSQARARIIRLRFPEWTLWDLPLAAHELGHVVTAHTVARESQQTDPKLRELTTFLEKQRDSLVAIDPELNKQHRAGAAEHAAAASSAMNRVRVFAADAFATYTMGPAYACSAIMLRLSPSGAAHGDTPADNQRAHVVLSMLRAMSENAGPERPYDGVSEMLEKAWSSTLERSNPGNKLTDADTVYLAELAKGFRDVSFWTLNTTAIYPPPGDQNDGWRQAQTWHWGWQNQMKNEEPLQVPEAAGGKLRDVLNATWLTRLMIEQDPAVRNRAYKELERVGRDLCNRIITAPTPAQRMRPSPANV